MSSEPSPGALGIVAIACDNSVAHGYLDIDDLLRSNIFLSGAGVEFFDSDGYRLAPVFDGTWQIAGLARTADEPDATTVQHRLCTMIRHANAEIRNDPQAFRQPVNASEKGSYVDADVVLPDLDGMDLTVSLQAYATILGHVEGESDRHRGGPLHNIMHALGRRNG